MEKEKSKLVEQYEKSSPQFKTPKEGIDALTKELEIIAAKRQFGSIAAILKSIDENYMPDDVEMSRASSIARQIQLLKRLVK